MTLTLGIDPGMVAGLPDADRARLAELLKIYAQHSAKNAIKARYYAGDVTLDEVNLGIALPQGFAGLQIGCKWGAKTVDVLAGRSLFDGFVGADGQDVPELQTLVTRNRLVAEYQRHCRDELTFGCTFATLSADPALGCRIRFHSPRTAAAKWDGQKGRIAYGFAVLEESFGWNFTILMWFFVSCAGLAVCLIATPIWKKFRRDYADNPKI